MIKPVDLDDEMAGKLLALAVIIKHGGLLVLPTDKVLAATREGTQLDILAEETERGFELTAGISTADLGE